MQNVKYNYEIEGISGIKHRFDVIINNDSKYLALDVMLNPSDANIIAFYIKCFDTKVKNAVLITSKLPDSCREILKSCNNSKIITVELNES
ncbi:MAG: hypothetical protein QXY40_01440 [Candidatus Methanomethylicia archaeon]